MFYIYDPITSLFSHTTEGQPNPLEGGFFTPPFSTEVPPPSVGLNEIVKYVNGVWTVVPDYSNEIVYSTVTAEQVSLEVGTDLSSEYTLEVPTQVFPKWNGLAWEEDAVKLEEQRQADITAEATRRIEEVYSPLKQRKMLSIAVALHDKVINGFVLTIDEELQLQASRDANDWITSIRTIENTAIANGTALVDVVWN